MTDALHELKQIKEAFIDGYLSAKGSDAFRDKAELAWKEENDPWDARSLRKRAAALPEEGK